MMSPLKQLLLRSWYYASLPLRRCDYSVRASQGQLPVAVLFYHRVADRTANDWTISCRRFLRQIRWLQKHRQLVSLSEAQRLIRNGCYDRMAVSITFDDGYADNSHWALPLLVEEGIPVTYFVSARHVLDGEPFPHDVQAGRPLPPNTVDELRWLAKSGVEIGCHTRTHADLGRINDPATLHDEVVAARDDLESSIDCRIRYFAFPFGQRENLNEAAVRIAREAGYEGVCSAYGDYNMPDVGADPFHLKRIHGDPELIRFKNWLTLDPRKLPPHPSGREQPTAAAYSRTPMHATK